MLFKSHFSQKPQFAVPPKDIYPHLVPTSQTDFQPQNPKANTPPSYFFLCWRIQTNYLHMCPKEPLGKGAKKNILLTEHKHWLHQTLRAACSDALHMPTWRWQPFADSTATSHQRDSLSSNAAMLFSICDEEVDGGRSCSLLSPMRSEEGLCFFRLSTDKVTKR